MESYKRGRKKGRIEHPCTRVHIWNWSLVFAIVTMRWIKSARSVSQEYVEMNKQDKERYARELEEEKQRKALLPPSSSDSDDEPAKKKKKSNVKRARWDSLIMSVLKNLIRSDTPGTRTAYMFFCMEMRKKIKEKNPGNAYGANK